MRSYPEASQWRLRARERALNLLSSNSRRSRRKPTIDAQLDDGGGLPNARAPSAGARRSDPVHTRRTIRQSLCEGGSNSCGCRTTGSTQLHMRSLPNIRCRGLSSFIYCPCPESGQLTQTGPSGKAGHWHEGRIALNGSIPSRNVTETRARGEASTGVRSTNRD